MFEPENELERLLVLATHDEAARPAFARALIDSRCFMALFNATPGMPITASGSNVIPEGAELAVNYVEHKGRKYVPFFSSPLRIWDMTRESHVAAPDTVRAMFERDPQNSYLLNPGSDFGKEFFPHEIDELLRGDFDPPQNGRRITEKEEHALIGVPTDYPHKFASVLRQWFSSELDVEQAFLSSAAIEGRPPVLLLEVVSRSTHEALMARLGPILERFRPPGRIIDSTVHTDSACVFAKGVVEPFYER
jgi:SseB protein C-terminal domain/SseB protein N-terminal domain